MFLAQHLDVVLNHQAAANSLDIDRHAPPVRRRGKAGGDVGWRTALILVL